jgi:predicted NAD-dependent protein-ADP-ribosyltransferase YbiA (DUF1768 family)
MSDRIHAKPEAPSCDTSDSQRLNLLDLQIRRHERQDHSRSHLNRAVNWAGELVGIVRTDESLSSLKLLKEEILEAQNSDTAKNLKHLEQKVDRLVKADQDALAHSNEITHYGTGLLKTAAFFFPGGAGRITAATTCGLDQARRTDSLAYQCADGSLGALKGLLTHSLISSFSTEKMGVAGKGVLVGMASRMLEIALDRRCYTSPQAAGLDFNLGASKLVAHASDPAVWLADGATFAVAHGMVTGVNRFSGGLIDSNRTLATALSGTSFGMVTGALTELGRQRTEKEAIDISKIATRSLIQGSIDTLAALPGGIVGHRNFNYCRVVTNGTESPLVTRYDAPPSRRTSLEYEHNHDSNGSKRSNKTKPGNDNFVLPTSRSLPESLMRIRPDQNGTSRVQTGADNSSPGGSGPQEAPREQTDASPTCRPKQAKSPVALNRLKLSDQTTPDGTRVIHKADGTVVTIGQNSTVIEQDGYRTTHRKDGPTTIEGPDGARLLRIIPKRRPHDCPLNVASQSKEGIGRKFSNFAQSRFTLDGVKYASVEAFYTCLKITDPVKRAEVAKLHGSAAKSAGREFKSKTGMYLDKTFELGSPEHHALIKRAIMAKFEQNSDLGQALVESHPRPITHNTGRPESPKTNYPAAVFIKTLSEVRDTLVKRENHAKAAPSDDSAVQRQNSEISLNELENRRMNGSDRSGVSEHNFEAGGLKPRPVWEILESINDKSAQNRHDLGLYTWALKTVDLSGTRYLGAGANTVRIELADGNVLKLTSAALTPEMGNRPFDLPIIGRGEITGGRYPVSYFSQPKALPVTEENYRLFRAQLQADGYVFTDPGLQQVGYYQGKILLLDPFAVARTDGQL